MPAIHRTVTILAGLAMLTGISSCMPAGPPSGTYTVNTFHFVYAGPPKDNGGPIPNLWIDTNMRVSSLSGGTVTSRLPCAVMLDYTDNSRSFQNAVITAVRITYEDDTIDPFPGAVALPLRIDAREHESVNSVAGGRIVKCKSRIISGSIPNVITRAEPFRLQMEGYFTQNDGSRVPVAIDQLFDIKTESSIKAAGEVLQDR
jgi:hypothetical protein